MAAQGSNLGEKFARKIMERFYATSIADDICNREWEGELKGDPAHADRLNIKTWGNVAVVTYSPGTGMTLQRPESNEAPLIVNQYKGVYAGIDDVYANQDYTTPREAFIQNAGGGLKEEVDTYVLGLYADAGSGNRVGTDYTTGTVAVANTGVVTGTGTTFTSAMVGLGFKVTASAEITAATPGTPNYNVLTAWYRIKTYSSGTSITIEGDFDDEATSYVTRKIALDFPGATTDGAHSATATYIIEAATVLTLSTSNIAQYIDAAAIKLDEQKIPKEDRWMVVPPKVASLIRRAADFVPAVDAAYEDVVKRGKIGMFYGFQIYESPLVAGNNTTGYYIVFGHKSAICLAESFSRSEFERVQGQFADAYKGLLVYGAKVADERRKAFGYIWGKV